MSLIKSYDIETALNKQKTASMYLHHVIECLENLEHEKCLKTTGEKRKIMRDILTHEAVQEAMCNVSRLNSSYTQVIYELMKRKQLRLMMIVIKMKSRLK